MSDLERSDVLSELENRAHTYFSSTGKPFVTIAYAQSLNGAIAGVNGQPVAISCPESLIYTHRLRAMHDAILVGIETVLSDDPALTTRLTEGEDPQRIILDSRLRIPLEARVLEPAVKPTLVITTPACDKSKAKILEQRGIHVIRLAARSNGLVNLRSMMPFLGALGVQKLMVEGGGRVIASFLEERCVNYMIVTLSMMMYGGRTVLDPLLQDKNTNGHPLARINADYSEWIGADLVLHGDPVWKV